jgi:hypothetical protein
LVSAGLPRGEFQGPGDMGNDPVPASEVLNEHGLTAVGKSTL